MLDQTSVQAAVHAAAHDARVTSPALLGGRGGATVAFGRFAEESSRFLDRHRQHVGEEAIAAGFRQRQRRRAMIDDGGDLTRPRCLSAHEHCRGRSDRGALGHGFTFDSKRSAYAAF